MLANHTSIAISNPKKPWLGPRWIRCHVDGSALMLSITRAIAGELELDVISKREIIFGDGSSHEVPYVGPVKLDFENCSYHTGAFVIGKETRFGAIKENSEGFVAAHLTPHSKAARQAAMVGS